MEKNKIPIWENNKNYLPELDFLVSDLLAISDEDYQLRVWYRVEGPEVDWYGECTLSFEEAIDYFKDLVRGRTEGPKLNLSQEQIKAILRVHVMCLRFYSMPRNITDESTWKESQLSVINHPYWAKIREKAKYALSLIRVKN